LQTKHLCPEDEEDEAEARLAEAGVSEDMLPWAGEVLPMVLLVADVVMMMPVCLPARSDSPVFRSSVRVDGCLLSCCGAIGSPRVIRSF